MVYYNPPTNDQPKRIRSKLDMNPSEKFLSEFVSWENHGNSQLNGNSLPTYPLVNCHITMENPPMFHGKCHYFYGDFP